MERAVPFLADTSGPFKQLLAAEQTAQSVQAWIQEKKDAIRSIKKQAIDQDIPYNTIYGHIKQLQDDIGGLKQLLESNKASRDHWRELHVAAWRATVRPLKVVDMPNEILTKIFANFEDVPVPQIQIDSFSLDDPLPSPDIAVIKNIRLTCRAFCEVASEILLPVLTISFSRSSLRRLEKISNHPTISKSVRVIRFDISPYKSWLTMLHPFYDAASSRLAYLRTTFEHHAMRTQREMAETLRRSGQRAEFSTSEIRVVDVTQNEEALAIANALERHPLLQPLRSVRPQGPFETRMRDAILQAHEEYKRRYSEQQSLFENHQVHAEILSSIGRMPLAQKVTITDVDGRQWHRAVKSGWGKKPDVQKYNAILLGTNPFHELMVQPGACEGGILAGDGEPPLSLLHQLPSMFQAVGQKLTHLDIDIRLHPQIHVEIPTGDLDNLRHTCQQLKSLKLRVVKPLPFLAPAGMSPECSMMIKSLLGAMIASPQLEELRLSVAVRSAFQGTDSPSIFHSVLENLTGGTLRDIWLYHIPIKFNELRQLLERSNGKLRLNLVDICLLDGTWAQALDILRGSTDSTSRIVFPRGGEMRNMSVREARYFQNQFRSQHRDGWYSDQRCPGPASFYVRGGNIPNPLMLDSD